MVDFLTVSTRIKNKSLEIYPKFWARKSKDLMIRGGDFYAIWDEERKLWSTDKYAAIELIDREIEKVAREKGPPDGEGVRVLYLRDSENGMIDTWNKYCQKQLPDNYRNLDETLIFSNMETTREDYASKKLSYPLYPGPITNYERLMSVLYSPEERKKIEWAIGAIVSGDSKTIQKFLVLYGAAGTGKSTVLNIILKLFGGKDGYCSVFDAKSLGSSNESFALEAFTSNPLVAIQHDGDLSRIEDNTRINSLVSHELMTVNAKHKSLYTSSFKCFLFMGTNKPVKITDARSGLLRRLIDVSPTGNKLSASDYNSAYAGVEFELGGIAAHCLEVYKKNKHFYDNYIPTSMMGASNDFFGFVEDSCYVFEKEDGITLTAAWEMYKEYCTNANVPHPFSRRVFQEEFKNYFKEFHERYVLANGERVRSYYQGFKTKLFEPAKDIAESEEKENKEEIPQFEFKEIPSLLDDILSECPAQYAVNDKPTTTWDANNHKLKELDTHKLHYILFDNPNHIVIDFDLKDETGQKSFERNFEAISKWPLTYAELSKSGQGIHLHYIYDGDVTQLERLYAPDIEIKVYKGKLPLRRKLTRCNDIPIAHISAGLPLKKEKPVLGKEVIENEKHLRNRIAQNLNKVHGSTHSSINFIYGDLEQMYKSGKSYDVSDLKEYVYAFARNSHNQWEECVKTVDRMHFMSEDKEETATHEDDGKPLAVFDIEVFPNVIFANWKRVGEQYSIKRYINPTPSEIEFLTSEHRLIGFNNLRYDNIILYAILIGWSVEQIYELSNRIINEKGFKSPFRDSKKLSYTDIYDYCAKKQSLKKWEVELRKKKFYREVKHKELGLRWDQPVPQEKWCKVSEYCDNDVYATEKVWMYTQDDFLAREILADLSGLTVNDTTNTLTTRIIFGAERHPELVYTDLSETFPGYEFAKGEDGKRHNMYRGTDIGFGGYIRSWPGIYINVALLDIASLHPNSIRAMQCFGKYTKNFTDLVDARVFIKHGDYESAMKLFGGKLAKYLTDKNTAKKLAQALKIAINSVYGLTAAKFDNPFRDPRNLNNIVALRGALFMRTLQDEVEARGFKIVAIKTDSIKIANATKDIIDFCVEFAKTYGYSFEHEATYAKMCQINDADYVAKYATVDICNSLYGEEYVNSSKEVLKDNKEEGDAWTATGKQFQIPYVFKTLFSHEEVTFEDLCEIFQVTSALHLDMNEDLGTDEHNYIFVGKIGEFCPIRAGNHAGSLVREAKAKDGSVKYDSAAGAKGYRWMESEMVENLGLTDQIDMQYYNDLASTAIEAIEQYGDFYQFAA